MQAQTITSHFSMSPPEAYHGETQRYVMFGFFSFHDGKLHLGQCQSVKEEDAALEREYLERAGRTKAGYRYVNGKAVLVPE